MWRAYVQAGENFLTTTTTGVESRVIGSGTKYGGNFKAGINYQSGTAYGVFSEALGSCLRYGGYFLAGSSLNSGTSYGLYSNAMGAGITYGANLHSGATDVSGTSHGIRTYAYSSDSVKYGGHFYASPTGTGSAYGVYARGGTYDFYAGGSGINYGSGSSGRWKQNIEPVESGLDKVLRLRGVTFDWDEEHGGQHDVGMIAEEVGEVLPEIVGYEENGVDAVGMDYSKLTPVLVEAVKELAAQNRALSKQVVALAARLAELE